MSTFNNRFNGEPQRIGHNNPPRLWQVIQGIALAHDLTRSEVRILMVVLDYAGNDNVCTASQRTIARVLMLSRRTVDDRLAALLRKVDEK